VWEWDKLKRIFPETLEDESIFLLDGCVLGSVDELGNIYPGAGKKSVAHKTACATHVLRPSAIVFVLVGGRPYTLKAIARETTRTTYRKYFDRIAFCFSFGVLAIVLPASTSFIPSTCWPVLCVLFPYRTTSTTIVAFASW